MVKFGKYLHGHSVPEWRSQYIRYKKLKKLLRLIHNELLLLPAPRPFFSSSSSSSSSLHRDAAAAENVRALAQLSHDYAAKQLHQIKHMQSSGALEDVHLMAPSSSSSSSSSPSSSPLHAMHESKLQHQPSVLHVDQSNHRLPLETLPNSHAPLPSSSSPSPSAAAAADNASSPAFFSAFRNASSSSALPPSSSSSSSSSSSADAEQPLCVLSETMKDVLLVEHEHDFFALLDHDLLKVERFFLRQEEFFLSKVEVLSEQITILLSQPQPHASDAKSLLPLQAARVLDRALKETFRGLQMLQNYRIMNYTAVIKIVKKYDKAANTGGLASQRCQPLVRATHFASSIIVDGLISQIESLYSTAFQRGDRKRAVAKLKVIEREMLNNGMSFRLGTLIGLSAALIVVLAFVAAAAQRADASLANIGDVSAMLPVFRCLGLLFLALFGWSLTIFLMEMAKVNWSFILELDPRSHMRFGDVFYVANLALLAWLGTVVLYLYTCIQRASNSWDVHPQYFPFALFVTTLCAFLLPLKVFYHKTRFFLARVLGCLVVSPFSKVAFVESFVGDQLCSLVNIFGDIIYSLCFFTTGDFLSLNGSRCAQAENYSLYFVALVPYYWRMMQCLRRYHDTKNQRFLLNSVKYVLSICVVLFNLFSHQFGGTALLVLWILFAAAAASFNILWDARFDWQLLDPACMHWNHPHFLLRPQLALPHRSIYYVALAANFVLRLAWVLSISPNFYSLTQYIPVDYLKSVVYSLEILRRCVWNVLRLDNEHETNCESNRAVHIIPLDMEAYHVTNGEPVHVHTAPEAIALIHRDSLHEAQADEAARSKEEKAMQSASKKHSPSVVVPIHSTAYDSSDDEEDQQEHVAVEHHELTPPEAQQLGKAASSPSSIRTNASDTNRLLAATSLISLACAGLPELKDVLSVAQKVMERLNKHKQNSTSLSSSPSPVISRLRAAYEQGAQQLGRQYSAMPASYASHNDLVVQPKLVFSADHQQATESLDAADVDQVNVSEVKEDKLRRRPSSSIALQSLTSSVLAESESNITPLTLTTRVSPKDRRRGSRISHNAIVELIDREQ